MKRLSLFLAALLLAGLSAPAHAGKGEILLAAAQSKTPFRPGPSRFEKIEEVAQDIPAVLSENDVKLYKRMFRLQRELKRPKVAALVPKLENRLLMGDLIAERLLHPRTRSSYGDLKAWLSRYHDQFQAPQIYRLANIRKPKRERHRAPSLKKTSLARYEDKVDEPSAKSEPTVRSRSRGALLKKLRRYRLRKQFDAYIKTLNTGKSHALLGHDTWHEVALTLSQSLMTNGRYADAETLARKVAVEMPEHRAKALWIAAFSAYRQGNKEDAGSLYRRLAYSVPLNSYYFSPASWWAARVYQELGRPAMSRVFLNMAAQDERSFYGQMANQRLGRGDIILQNGWKSPEISLSHRENLFKDKGIRRVIALVQIGEHTLAQREMKTVYSRIPYDWDESLLAISVRLGLPGTSLTLARNLAERKKNYLEGLYPIPIAWKPLDGIKVDRALLYAISRQESAFNPAIKSRAGARGLMQLMPATAKFIRYKTGKRPFPTYSLSDPEISMTLGQSYLSYLLNEFDGNLIYTIAAYNAGPGNVRKWIGKNPDMAGDPLLFVESIPYTETRKYVMKVLGNLWMYRARFQQERPVLSAMANSQWPVRIAFWEKEPGHDG